jgi:M6 family metalloprotease-like protein
VEPCRFAKSLPGVGLGVPLGIDRLPSTGTVRLKVLLVDFPDGPATRTPDAMFAMVSPGSEEYFRHVSRGRLELHYDPVLRWIRMGRSAGDYNFRTFVTHRDYIQEAVDRSGADFSGIDGLVVLASPEAPGLSVPGPAMIGVGASGVLAGGRVQRSAITSGRDLLTWGAFWANHELLHNMGLPDLYDAAQPIHRHVGMFSLMGNIAGPARELFAWERWNLGWIDDAAVWCITASGSTDIDLVQSGATGVMMAVVPLSSTEAVVVESRRIGGYNAGFRPGALVYTVNVTTAGQAGPIQVLPVNGADVLKGDAPIQQGQSLTHHGVNIQVVSASGERDRVRVIR